MKERTRFHITKRRVLSNYKVAGLSPLFPVQYNLRLFSYCRMEGVIMGLLMLPVTSIITPMMLLGTVVAFGANTLWGLGALPVSWIRDFFYHRVEESTSIEAEHFTSSSIAKMQSLFLNQAQTDVLAETSLQTPSLNSIIKQIQLDESDEDLEPSEKTCAEYQCSGFVC